MGTCFSLAKSALAHNSEVLLHYAGVNNQAETQAGLVDITKHTLKASEAGIMVRAAEGGPVKSGHFWQLLDEDTIETNNNVQPQHQFLKLNNVVSSSILDENGSPAAVCVMHRYGTDRAYCCVTQVQPTLAQHRTVSIRPTDTRTDNDNEHKRTTEFSITNVQEGDTEIVDLSNEAMFFCHTPRKQRSAAEHVVDACLVSALGRKNLELTKNATIDLVDVDSNPAQSLALWRDRMGFVVSDRIGIAQLVISPSALSSTLSSLSSTKSSISQYQLVDVSCLDPVLMYDRKVCGFDRTEFVQFVHQELAQSIRLAYTPDGALMCGMYVLLSDNRLGCLYADNAHVMRALLEDVLQSAVNNNNTREPLSMSVVLHSALHETLQQHVHAEHMQCTTVRRLHTTSAPTCVLWDNVHVLMQGLHIV